MTLESSLIAQLRADGVNNPVSLAREIMIEGGYMTQDGKLTETGKARQKLGSSGRAKDRAADASDGKHKPSDYVYHSKTHSATLRKTPK